MNSLSELRDVFAGLALQGLLAQESDDFAECDDYRHPENREVRVYGGKLCYKITSPPGVTPIQYNYSETLQPILVETREQILARKAYEQADAMLKERAKQKDVTTVDVQN